MSESKTTLEERNALAMKYFPESWANAQTEGKSKQRNNLRKHAEQIQLKEQLKADGASCSTCWSFVSGGPCGSYCDADTDYYGYALTKPEGLCYRWHKKKEEAA